MSTPYRYRGKQRTVRAAAVEAGFRSGFEQQFAAKFPDYQYEPDRFPYTIQETRNYTPDFVGPDGTWYELKGRFTASDRKKMKLIKEQYPQQRIVLVFQNPRVKLTKAKRSRWYCEWADQNGFEWIDWRDL